MTEEKSNLIVSRHGDKNGDKLSAFGIHESRRIGKEELLETISHLPPDSIIIPIASEAERTKETASTMLEGLSEMEQDTILITSPSGKTFHSAINSINETLEANPDKRVVVNYPLFVRGQGLHETPETDLVEHPYFDNLYRMYGEDFNKQFYVWIDEYVSAKEEGIEFDGPKPEDIANNYMEAQRRMSDFVQRNIAESQSDRPITIMGVSHSWVTDATILTNLSQKGEITRESFNRFKEFMGGGTFETGEVACISTQDGRTTLQIRGQLVDLPSPQESETQSPS